MSPEPEATPAAATRDAFSISADTLGHDLLAALLGELRSMPDHWARLNEQNQQKILDNLKDKIRATVEKVVALLVRGELAAVPADLKTVSWGSNIAATLSIRRDAMYRHALSDAQGQKVLVVLTDATRWMQRMDEIKARGDQLELWGNDYDPAVDQPGYRRDQDRISPAGQTWADLKKNLDIEGQPKDDAATGDGAEPAEGSNLEDGGAPEGVDETNLSDAERETVALRMLQETLSTVGVTLSLGALRVLAPEQIKAGLAWVEAYAAEGDSCKVERPDWIPEPDKGEQP